MELGLGLAPGFLLGLCHGLLGCTVCGILGHIRFQFMNSSAERLVFGDHLLFELVERDVQIVRHVDRGDELAHVLKAAGSAIKISSRRQQRLKLRSQLRMLSDLLSDIGLGLRSCIGSVANPAPMAYGRTACLTSTLGQYGCAKAETCDERY